LNNIIFVSNCEMIVKVIVFHLRYI
jgi:hypothetical protein